MLSVWRSVLCVCIYVRMSILLSIAQGERERDQWITENNLAHLLEYTPGLKTLNVVASRGRSQFSYSYGNPLLFYKGTKSFWHLEHLNILVYKNKSVLSLSRFTTCL